MVIIIGLNGFIFNGFMALIYKNALPDIITRSSFDIAALLLSSIVSGRILKKR